MFHELESAEAKPNVMKHAVPFADPVAVYENDMALTIEDDHPGEDRYGTSGMNTFGRAPASWRLRSGLFPMRQKKAPQDLGVNTIEGFAAACLKR